MIKLSNSKPRCLYSSNIRFGRWRIMNTIRPQPYSSNLNIRMYRYSPIIYHNIQTWWDKFVYTGNQDKRKAHHLPLSMIIKLSACTLPSHLSHWTHTRSRLSSWSSSQVIWQALLYYTLINANNSTVNYTDPFK